MSHFLTLDDVRDICYVYARDYLTHDEPIPSFDSRFPEKLEAALHSPQTSVGGRQVYPLLSEQAAVLFYELIKQHPFLNGNKRIACVALMAFLSLNHKWLKTTWRELYDIAVTVAAAKSNNREGILRLLTDFVQNGIVES